MKIWEATEIDLTQMIDIWWEMQSSHDNYDPKYYQTRSENECRGLARKYFKEFLLDKNHLFLVAGVSEKIVGMIHLQILIKPPVYRAQRYALIQDVVVTQSYQNRGIFKALLDHAKDRLRLENINLMELLVDENNPAVKAYGQVGFTTRQRLMIKWF